MKRNLILIGIFAVLVFGLAIFTGCAEKKTVVTDGSTQEQKVAAAQTADTTADTTKEQSAKVRAAAIAATVRDINFDFDKSNIRPDAREILKTNADVFLNNSASTIVIGGYCDERGTAEYNMALGQKRAQEAKKYLVNLGIKESKMKTISYGEERPLDPGHDEEAWDKNRRAHFVATP